MIKPKILKKLIGNLLLENGEVIYYTSYERPEYYDKNQEKGYGKTWEEKGITAIHNRFQNCLNDYSIDQTFVKIKDTIYNKNKIVKLFIVEEYEEYQEPENNE